MNPLAIMSSMSGAIPTAMPQPNCDEIETDDVNTEWENGLKDQMPAEIKKIMDAICQRFSSGDGLKSCKNGDENENTVNLVNHMTSETETLILHLFGGSQPNISRYLLNYVPTPTTNQGQTGGNDDTPTLAKLGTTDAAGAIGSVTGAATDAATDAEGAIGSVTGAAKPTRKKELTDGKAETILNLYTNHIINQIKCNSDTAQILQTKIIDTMIISITDNLNINSLELFSELAKETTVRCMKDRISLITPTMEVYKNIISTATATATATEEILPDYIRLLLELFVYREYAQLLNDADIELNIDELTTLITTHRKALKPVRESAKKIMANTNEGMVQAIQNLNGFPRPNGGTEVDTIAVPSSNNQNALAKFKALFEEETEETKGGGRKKHTRKHKRHHKKRRSTRRYR